MSTVAEATVKPAEEFVVYTDDSVTPANEDKTSSVPADPPQTKTQTSEATVLSLDTSDTTTAPVNRTDSFPKTLPLPASSILSPTSAAQKKDLLPPLSEQAPPPGAEDIVSPPEKDLTESDMLVQTSTLTPLPDALGTSTPLAELAGTDFDQQVAMRRRGDSILGEEISDGVSNLKVEEEEPTTAKHEHAKDYFSEQELAARKNDPAIVSTLPQTPSAADFEVAKTHEGSNFNPEYPNETKVAS